MLVPFAQRAVLNIRGSKIGGQNFGIGYCMNLGEASKGSWSEMKKQQGEKSKNE